MMDRDLYRIHIRSATPPMPEKHGPNWAIAFIWSGICWAIIFGVAYLFLVLA